MPRLSEAMTAYRPVLAAIAGRAGLGADRHPIADTGDLDQDLVGFAREQCASQGADHDFMPAGVP